MKKYRWQLIIILVTGLIVGLILIINQQTPITVEGDVPNPVSGGTYTEALVGRFQRLNPFLDDFNQPDQDIDRLIFSSLVKFDNSGLPQPDLAETWGISQDGALYNFSIRPDIFWHDGQPLTTADIAFTVDLLKSGNALIPLDLQGFWAEVELNVISDYQLQFALPEAFSPFLDYLAFGILPQHLLGELSLDEMIDHPFNLAPVGTGPYQFDRLLLEGTQITGVVLQANPSYFLGKPFIEEIAFQYYSTETEAVSAYKNGEVEGFSGFSSEILNEVLSDSKLNIYSASQPLISMVYLNLDDPGLTFFQEPGFRKALLMAIDRQRMIDGIFGGQAVMLDGPILPGNWAYYPDLVRIDYSPELAMQELFRLGYKLDSDGLTLVDKDDKSFEFSLLCPDTDENIQVCAQIVEDWSALGMQVSLDVQPYQLAIDKVESRNYEAALVNIDLSQSPDPDPYPFWAQSQMTGGQNYAQWDNRTASEYLEQARISLDRSDRERLYRNFQVIFQKEMPALPLFSPIFNYTVTTKVKGISIGPFYDESDRFFTAGSWYILSEKSELE